MKPMPEKLEGNKPMLSNPLLDLSYRLNNPVVSAAAG
jgi:hypothetical protein